MVAAALSIGVFSQDNVFPIHWIRVLPGAVGSLVGVCALGAVPYFIARLAKAKSPHTYFFVSSSVILGLAGIGLIAPSQKRSEHRAAEQTSARGPEAFPFAPQFSEFQAAFSSRPETTEIIGDNPVHGQVRAIRAEVYNHDDETLERAEYMPFSGLGTTEDDARLELQMYATTNGFQFVEFSWTPGDQGGRARLRMTKVFIRDQERIPTTYELVACYGRSSVATFLTAAEAKHYPTAASAAFLESIETIEGR